MRILSARKLMVYLSKPLRLRALGKNVLNLSLRRAIFTRALLQLKLASNTYTLPEN